MSNILITGGSGMVGKKLTKELLDSGHNVRHVSRTPATKALVPVFKWNVAKGSIDPEALKDLDHIVHLAGAPIVEKKWTTSRVKELISSRAASAELLIKEVERLGISLKGFHSASGSNYYGGAYSDHIYTENDPGGEDTIGHITVEWEKSVRKFEAICRTVRFRIGMIISKEGGALSKLSSPIRYGIGSPIGGGNQWVPWIHIDDVVGLFKASIENPTFEGVYNSVADETITNAQLVEQIARILNKPFWAPKVPAFVLRIMLGERAGLVLNGYRISNDRLKQIGFEFKYATIEAALKEALS